MRQYIRIAIFASMLCGIGGVSSQAAVVTIEGTIKAVDAAKRTITVETGAEVKTLDVSSKAKIAIEGKDAAVDSLRPGQKVKLSYHDELEVVLSIKAEPTPDNEVPRKDGCRLIWRISETGDCTIRIGRPSVDRPTKESVGNGLTRIRLDDGTWLCEHRFNSSDALEALSGRSVQNASIAHDKRCLVLTPKLNTGNNHSLAVIYYPCRLRLPLTVELDIEELGADGKLQISPNCPTTPLNLHPFLDLTTIDKLSSKAKVTASWISGRDAQGKPIFERLLEKEVNLASPFEESFRLPLPNMPIDDVFELQLGQQGDSPALISRFAVRGRLIPLFGVGWNQKDNVVFATSVVSKGLADRAGVQIGDILVTVNGEAPKSVAHAVELMSQVGFGETCNLSLRRGSKQLAVELKAD